MSAAYALTIEPRETIVSAMVDLDDAELDVLRKVMARLTANSDEEGEPMYVLPATGSWPVSQWDAT